MCSDERYLQRPEELEEVRGQGRLAQGLETLEAEQ